MKRKLHVFRTLIFGILLLPSSVLALENIQVGTTTRTMLVYAPANLGQKRPMIISCHGMNQDANFQKSEAKYEPIADTAKFLVVFPSGIGNSWDISGNSDIDFMTTIIDTMVNRYNIDRNRVYLSGFSMGGMFTYHAMGRIADKIAAFAPISGYPLGGSSFTSSRPVPIIHTHGTGDDVVNFGGVASVLAGWVARNNCPTTAVKTKPYPANVPSSVCTKSYWGPGDEGVEVVLMELAGKGHWISNDVANGIYTSNEIWNFCKKYSLNLVNPVVKITAPLSNSTYTIFESGATLDKITITATASDPDGTVASVAFYDGATLLNTDVSAPYTFDMTNVAAGTHTIKALVTDNEGKTGQSTVTVVVNAVSAFTLSSNFNTAGMVPTGWKTYDGSTLRVGPQSGLSSGCRVFQFTGSPRDFDWGMYVRNTTGKMNEGYISYGSKESGTILNLLPGIYQLSYKFANWNSSTLSELTSQIEEQTDGTVLASRTTKATNNIGNSASNSFSGTKNSTLWFTVTERGNYEVKFYTANAPMADAAIANIVMTKVENDPLATYKSTLCKSLGDAKIALKAASDTLYKGSAFNNLESMFNLYNEWTFTESSEFVTAAQNLDAATQTLITYKESKDASESQVEIFKDNFATSGAGTLPQGWKTYDSSTQRRGALTGLGSGSRIFQLTGATRDFDYALYIRNIAGTAKMGFAKFGALYTDSLLTLTPGKYKLSYKVCNWNMPSFGAITGKITNRADSSEIASSTNTPTTNIGNSMSNSFSGSTPVEINFAISTTGNYALEFYTPDAGWGDAIISNISLVKIVYTALENVSTQKTIKQIKYYNINGIEMRGLSKGFNIERRIFNDGTIQVSKIFLK